MYHDNYSYGPLFTHDQSTLRGIRACQPSIQTLLSGDIPEVLSIMAIHLAKLLGMTS